MVVVRKTLERAVEDVFAVLIDPETYPHWLVGACDIRAVDDAWPAVGSAFHHRVGLLGPITVADLSKVVEVDRPRRLRLEVRARPFGRGLVCFDLASTGVDEGRTTIDMDEVPIGRLARLRPVLDPLVAGRNRRSLDHLEDYVLHGTSHRPPG